MNKFIIKKNLIFDNNKFYSTMPKSVEKIDYC